MTCKPFINAINTTNQLLLTDGLVEFATTTVNTGCGIEFVNGSNTITIVRPGYYEISFDADVSPTTAGVTGVQVLNNGSVVPGAVATFTGTAGDSQHLHVQTAVRVLTSCKCVVNNAVIQIQLTAGATVDNANIIIEPVKM